MSLLPKKALKKLVKSVSEAKGIVYYFYLHHNGLKTPLKQCFRLLAAIGLLVSTATIIYLSVVVCLVPQLVWKLKVQMIQLKCVLKHSSIGLTGAPVAFKTWWTRPHGQPKSQLLFHKNVSLRDFIIK